MNIWRMYVIPATNTRGTRVKIQRVGDKTGKVYGYPYEVSGCDAMFKYLTDLEVVKSFDDTRGWLIIAKGA
jgi:hypothetical protein